MSIFKSLRNVCIAILMVVGWATATTGSADRPPNILFIMSDDHSAAAISAYGGRLAEIAPTPNIDRLAREGAVLTNAFCTNSICSPSRACVLTGQYNHVNGAFDLAGSVQPGDQMLPLVMKRAGYETAMIGKWHLKAEPSDFDYYCVLPGQGQYHDPDFLIRGEKEWGQNRISMPGTHSTDAITDLSMQWLRENWGREKPFFLMHHYKAPHDYFDNAERYEDYLAGEDIPAPKSLWFRHPQFGSMATRGHQDELLPHIGTSIGGRNPRRSYLGDLPELYPNEFPQPFDPSRYTDDENKRMAYNAYLRKYLRCVKGIDDNLGRLFAFLESEGQLDNTVIFYTGDQGFMLGEHDYQDKRWMYDPSQRMPFLVRHPSTIAAGTTMDAIVENVDYGPTMIDFAGGVVPESVQGRSFKTMLRGEPAPADWKSSAYYRYWMHMAHHDNPAHMGIRTKSHKLIYYYGCNYDGGYQTPPGWELYDLVNDPEEIVNLVGDPASQPLLRTMKEQLAMARKRVGDDGSHYPECEKVIQSFWANDEEDRRIAKELSHQYLQRRQLELSSQRRNIRTWHGHTEGTAK